MSEQAVINTLNTQALLAEARSITGIDIVDHDAVEPLTVLCKSLSNDSALHEQGIVAQREKLLRLLANRLRMQRDLAAHPDILEQELKPPVFIISMPRTGSTKMQKLLAATGDFNWLPFWQSFNPASFTGKPNEPVEARIASADQYNNWFDAASPEAKYGHDFDTLEPNEESFLLEQSLRTAVFFGWSDVPGYLEWLMGQDLTIQFRYLKDSLKYLQWQGLHDPSKNWVLKCPLYGGLEPALLHVFPDARLIMTHREPANFAPSAIKLVQTYHKPHTEAYDYNVAIAGLAVQSEAHIANRNATPDFPVLDVYYRELVGSEITVIEKIYEFLDQPLNEETKRRVQNWVENNPKNKKGAFNYSLEEFDCTTDSINAQFQQYNQLLEKLFPEQIG